MFFRSTDVLYPWDDWVSELKIERMPRPLPTRDDLAKLCEKADGSYEPAIEEFKKRFDSLPGYWNTTPREATCELLDAEQIRWDGVRFNPATPAQRRDHRLQEGVGLVVMEVPDDSHADAGGPASIWATIAPFPRIAAVAGTRVPAGRTSFRTSIRSTKTAPA